MMLRMGHLDPAERQKEKERSRASDADQLRRGSVSSNVLRGRNGFFSSLEVVSSSVSRPEDFA